MDGASAGDEVVTTAGESPETGTEATVGNSIEGRATAADGREPETDGTDESPEVPAGRTADGAVTRSGDDGMEDSNLPFYEWVGMLAGGLGIFLTPLLTGPVVGYCYLQLREEKPRTALLLLALVLGTAVFWAFASVVLIAPNL